MTRIRPIPRASPSMSSMPGDRARWQHKGQLPGKGRSAGRLGVHHVDAPARVCAALRLGAGGAGPQATMVHGRARRSTGVGLAGTAKHGEA